MDFFKRLIRRIIPPAAPPPPPPVAVQEWSIGIYAGTAPWELSPLDQATNPVLTRLDVTDADASFVADPFMMRSNGAWYMFFEVMNHTTGKGEIALATSPDGCTWRYEQIVLADAVHLSYPYVLSHGGDVYMIPESWKAGEVRLYRAARFPTDWVLESVLLRGPYLADSSVFRSGDRWWMLVEAGADFSFDTVRLYGAPELVGPWEEHPASPVVSGNPHIARPAGRVLIEEGRIIRFAQDCAPEYGLRVTAHEILELTVDRYLEHPLGSREVLGATGSGWNSHGMHHIDAHRLETGCWLACVDGWQRVMRT